MTSLKNRTAWALAGEVRAERILFKDAGADKTVELR